MQERLFGILVEFPLRAGAERQCSGSQADLGKCQRLFLSSYSVPPARKQILINVSWVELFEILPSPLFQLGFIDVANIFICFCYTLPRFQHRPPFLTPPRTNEHVRSFDRAETGLCAVFTALLYSPVYISKCQCISQPRSRTPAAKETGR